MEVNFITDGYDRAVDIKIELPREAKIIILNSVSGVGRSTLMQLLMEQLRLKNIRNVTSRPKRLDDPKEDWTYTFETKDSFRKLIENGQLLCYDFWSANNQYYGILINEIQTVATGNTIFDTTYFGGILKAQSPAQIMNLWLVCQDESIIQERLMGRASEASDELEKRWLAARDEQRFIVGNQERLIQTGQIDKVLTVDQLDPQQLAEIVTGLFRERFENDREG